MTPNELKNALETRRPVLWRGRYDHELVRGSVTALIYRNEGGKMILSAELTDYSVGHSRIICRPEDLTYWSIEKDNASYVYPTNTRKGGE